MKPHESLRINKKSIRGNSGDSWPVWNRGINYKAQLSSINRRLEADFNLNTRLNVGNI